MATPALAAPDWHAKGREIFETAINIPTTESRPEEMKKLVSYLKSQFEAAGIKDVLVKDHDGTQSMIVRWKAEGKPSKKPILLLGHMDVVDALAKDWVLPPFTLTEKDGFFFGRGFQRADVDASSAELGRHAVQCCAVAVPDGEAGALRGEAAGGQRVRPSAWWSCVAASAFVLVS